MRVLITYDVDTSIPEGKRRLRKVAKTCKDYGVRVQNSVFECVVTMAQLALLKSALLSIIDVEMDSLRFYKLGKDDEKYVETFGKCKGINVNDILVI